MARPANGLVFEHRVASRKLYETRRLVRLGAGEFDDLAPLLGFAGQQLGELRRRLQQRGCTAFQTWGFTDRYSWIPGYTKGAKGRALLFDQDYLPKPAYNALREVLQGLDVSIAALMTSIDAAHSDFRT